MIYQASEKKESTKFGRHLCGKANITQKILQYKTFTLT